MTVQSPPPGAIIPAEIQIGDHKVEIGAEAVLWRCGRSYTADIARLDGDR